MRNIWFLLMLIPTLMFGQSIKPKVSSTTVVIGKVEKNCMAVSHKTEMDNVILKHGSVVLVCGAEKYMNKSCFDIYYMGKQYYVDKDLLSINGSITYEDIEAMTEDDKKKFCDNAKDIEYGKVQNFVKRCTPVGLMIYKWSYYDESEYTEGTSANISVYNLNPKTIKYIWFNFIGYNPVGDKIIDPKTRSSIIPVRAIGPIETGKKGEYEFNYVWFTDMVETAKISSIKVLYMDGSQKIITNPDAITLSDENREMLENH